MNKSENLFNYETLNKLHHQENLTLPEIAEKYNTYPNKIRREMIKCGVPIKNRSETMKSMFATGKKEHPTKGKSASEETKIKIGESLTKSWDSMSEERREERTQQVKDNLGKADRANIKDAALAGILKAAKEGSKLEKFIYSLLVQEGYLVEYHKEHLIINERLHLDLFLPKMNVAIEIDGPTHHTDMFGQQNLSKTQVRDLQKTGLIISKGLVMIRVIQDRKLTKTQERLLGKKVLDMLEELKTQWPDKENRIKTIKLGV